MSHPRSKPGQGRAETESISQDVDMDINICRSTILSNQPVPSTSESNNNTKLLPHDREAPSLTTRSMNKRNFKPFLFCDPVPQRKQE